MIRYALACDAGHRFESWFGNSAAFDSLLEQGILTCPTCGSQQVAKTIMAPAVVARRGPPAKLGESSPVEAGPAPVDVALLDDKRQEIRNAIRVFRDMVLAETQDVGPRFPEEARRMHDGEIAHREIRGQATIDEARALIDDGIMVLPLPTLPDDLN